MNFITKNMCNPIFYSIFDHPYSVIDSRNHMVLNSRIPGKPNMIDKASKHSIGNLPLKIVLAVSHDLDEAREQTGVPNVKTKPLNHILIARHAIGALKKKMVDIFSSITTNITE